MQKDTTTHETIDTLKEARNDSFLDDKVNYKAEDSISVDIANKKAYLYNNAEVYYQNMILKAGYIEIDFDKKLVMAKGVTDSSGQLVQQPNFEQGEEKFTAREMTYNFETKKGKIKDIITKQGEGYIHGADIKRDTNNIFYIQRGRYTTCDLPEDPHFYFEAQKIKVIPNSKIITGPSELYIADVPTPVILPFGYFPNKKGRQSGLILPGYGESDRLGFFLSNGGFYFGGSELFDLQIMGDIYSTGGFATKTTSSYNKRYKHNGNVNFYFSHLFTQSANPELARQPTLNDYKVIWLHNQDARSHPNSRFSANVNFGTSTFGRYNGSTTDYLTTSYSSNISYSKTFPGTPFSLNGNVRHSQNVQSRMVDIDLPMFNASMTRIFPFKNEKRVGKRWYDDIGISANLVARNSISAVDSAIFKEKTFQEKLRNGAQLQIPISTSFTVLKYFRVTPSINTTSNLYSKTIRKSTTKDTMGNDKLIIDTVPTVRLSSEMTANASVSTIVYGNYFFKTRHLKQIRHVITPTVGFSYRPDYGNEKFGYYKTYSDSKGEHQYSIFEGGLYSGPSAGKMGAINFGLNNTFEAKIKSASDTGEVAKKIALLDNLSAGVSYNMAAERFKWSNVHLGARTRLFNQLDITGSATVDLYEYQQQNINGKRYLIRRDTLELADWKFGQKLGHLTDVALTVSTSLKNKEKAQGNNSATKTPEQFASIREELQYLNNNPNAYIDFNIPWNLNISYSIYYTPVIIKTTADSLKKQIVQTASFNGNLSITKSWKISFSSGFDFTTKKLTVTSINISRDLHCWQLNFSWVPFGFRQYFMLQINVKSAMLRDLRLKKQSPNSVIVPGY